MSADRVLQSVTCLGCGCGCDDLTVRVRDGRIVELSPPCPLARRWFGDGTVPGEIRVDGRPATIEKAIEAAAAVLSGAARPLVLIAPDLTTQAQRTAIAVGDALRAEVDGATSDSAAAAAYWSRSAAAAPRPPWARSGTEPTWCCSGPWIRASATPATWSDMQPRLQRPTSRRRDAALGVGRDRSRPGEAELEAEFTPGEEVDALAVMQATVRGQRLGELPARLRPAVAIAERLMQGKYVAIVHDAEPGREARDAQRTEGLVALAQALNGPTRAALSSLRAGGNRSGAEAALTWQTGYPMRVSFREGHPRCPAGALRPRPAARRAAPTPSWWRDRWPRSEDPGLALDRVPGVVIGPRASAVAGARVAIDTGIAGIHEPGTGYRMDDVPLPLSPVLESPRAAAETLGLLLGALRRRAAGRSR